MPYLGSVIHCLGPIRYGSTCALNFLQEIQPLIKFLKVAPAFVMATASRPVLSRVPVRLPAKWMLLPDPTAWWLLSNNM